MIYRQQKTSDHFWVGFITGVVSGGVLGVLLASEAGRSAREHLEARLTDVRSRFNGSPESTPADESPEIPETPEEHSS